MKVLEWILPTCVCVAERWRSSPPGDLFPSEAAFISSAVPPRRSEFATGRVCARAALGKLGARPVAIMPGAAGEPMWPHGIVGSITHCEGYCSAAVARADEVALLGIDAEPHRSLPPGLISLVARPEEHRRLEDVGHHRPDIAWDRLIFSAKEAIYKAVFPRTGAWLDFHSVSVDFDAFDATFRGSIPAWPHSRLATSETGIRGRWIVCNGVIVTAVSEALAERVSAGSSQAR